MSARGWLYKKKRQGYRGKKHKGKFDPSAMWRKMSPAELDKY